ncbi:hypothetical protein ACFQZT_19880 [Paenibacillus sp. GCM10027628]|uniref:hypothetical protein n=1 Tax=Paenibacillus sp. GCM10027628 TaxID=3273413 RepID=UPI0036363E8A
MSRTKTLWLLIGLHLIFVLFIFVWLFLAGMAMMGFSDASVLKEKTTWYFLAYLAAYPLGLLVTIIAGWWLFIRKKFKAALLWNLVPSMWILSVIIILVYNM